MYIHSQDSAIFNELNILKKLLHGNLFFNLYFVLKLFMLQIIFFNLIASSLIIPYNSFFYH